jgi:predicted dehydrogenase
MDKLIRWGVLSTAKIGMKQVIPAMQKAEGTVVAAIASRDSSRAAEAAEGLGIERSYGSYEQLLSDPDIDAIYIPLPNHMHVPWIKKAAQEGKHVLCEKPLALHAGEIRDLIALRDEKKVVIGEAFMVLHHPRWQRVRQLIEEELVGTLRHVDGFFSFFNVDASNIRNNPEYGGGSVYDIGVYPVVTTRMATGEEPLEVMADGSFDPAFGVDTLSSVLMRFPTFTASFTCSMQISAYQQMRFFGEASVMSINMPFNPPDDQDLTIDIATGIKPEECCSLEAIPACNHYTLQAEAFRESILHGTPFAGGLEHAFANESVIDAIYRSMKSRAWETVIRL